MEDSNLKLISKKNKLNLMLPWLPANYLMKALYHKVVLNGALD